MFNCCRYPFFVIRLSIEYSPFVHRYNPAAERVRQRAKWMEQVIIEEQNKPLELDTDAFSRLIELVYLIL